MASVVEPSSRPLSLQIDTPASASPFPSPSSSFLPPPMPGAHEFAVKPPPRRKSTLSSPANPDSSHSINGNQTPEKRVSMPLTPKTPTNTTTNGHPPGLLTPGHHKHTSSDPKPAPPPDPELLSPTTPTPANLQHHHNTLFAAGTAPSPSTPNALPPAPQPLLPEKAQPVEPTTPLSNAVTTSTPTPTSFPDNTRPPLSPVLTRSPSLSSTRPAPPSPAESRRISTISIRSSGSRPPSAAVSRSNSQRRSIGIGLSTPGSKRQSQLGALSETSGGGGGGGNISSQSPQLISFAGLKEADESIAAVTASSAMTTTTTKTVIGNVAATPIVSATPTTTTTTSAKPKPRKRSTRVKIKIRDFAFVTSDDRYRGMGVNVPKPNRFSRLNKKLGGSRKVRPTSKRWSTTSSITSNPRGGGAVSPTSSSDDEDGDEDGGEDESEGWFRRGMGRFSWSFGFGGMKKQQQTGRQYHQYGQPETQAEREELEEESYPSRGDMERNFLEEDEHGEGDDASGQSSEVYYDAEDDLEERLDEGEEGEEEEEPLFPGLYRALFAFEPEGTAEMRLVEDQIVRVVGRGGGVGWAVAVVPDEAEGGVAVEGGIRHALVPESYLEVVTLD